MDMNLLLLIAWTGLGILVAMLFGTLTEGGALDEVVDDRHE